MKILFGMNRDFVVGFIANGKDLKLWMGLTKLHDAALSKNNLNVIMVFTQTNADNMIF